MFSRLKDISDSVLLSDFVRDNQRLIESFTSSNIALQRQQQDYFEQFVLLKSNVIDSLDFGHRLNRAFVSVLFDYAERTNSQSSALRLFHIIREHNVDVGSRLEAAMLYLFNVPDNQIFIDRFDDICSKLQVAIDEEEDNDAKAISTFLNYYSYVVYNTAPHIQFAQQLQSKAISSSDKYEFLKNVIIQKTIALDINQAEMVYSTTQDAIDTLLGHCLIAITGEEEGFLIETDTEYCEVLSRVPKSFSSIRELAIKRLDSIVNQDDVFHSLKRGVAILQQEDQLFYYMKSYGMMHKAKLVSAFNHVPFSVLNSKTIEVIDWSCGQGLASIVLLEYMREHNIQMSIDKVMLVEPSKIALQRASLHVRHFNNDISITTVLKDMDSLSSEDFNSSEHCVKLHLFSNILDVELFSMQHLIELTHKTFKGINYLFVLVPI